MEVFVDVGWNGLTAEIVVGGNIKNYDDERVIYGFVGNYKVGRKTKRLKQLDEVYLNDSHRRFGGLPKRRDNAVRSAYFGRTDSHTLGGQLAGYTYFVEAEATLTAQSKDVSQQTQSQDVSKTVPQTPLSEVADVGGCGCGS